MKKGFLNNRKDIGLGDSRSVQKTSDKWNAVPSVNGERDPAEVTNFWKQEVERGREYWKRKEQEKDTEKDECMEEKSAAPMETEPDSAPADVPDISVAGHEPFLPPRMHEPKSALNWWYGKDFKIAISTKRSYLFWHDDGMPHQRKFTSIFVCPITGEVFSCGKFGSEEYHTDYTETIDETGASTVWYTKKTDAEHGAASRAFDCLSLRKYTPIGMKPIYIGKEMPYMTPQEAPPLPSKMPDDVRNRIEAGRKDAKQQESPQPSKTDLNPKQELTQWYDRRPERCQLTRDRFIAWGDDGMPHVRRFTAVFVCPLSGEIFPCGRYGNDYQERMDPKSNCPVYWYSKKQKAVQAAAARAYDCWCFRLEGRTQGFLGRDAPYAKTPEGIPLPTFPPKELVWVSVAQGTVNELQSPLMSEAALPMDKQALEDRAEYRAGRNEQGEVDLTMDEP